MTKKIKLRDESHDHEQVSTLEDKIISLKDRICKYLSDKVKHLEEQQQQDQDTEVGTQIENIRDEIKHLCKVCKFRGRQHVQQGQQYMPLQPRQ